MIYKKGDRVKIKQDAQTIPEGCAFNRDMRRYKGRIVTLTRKNYRGNWAIEEDSTWVFNESWFEELHNFKNIEKII